MESTQITEEYIKNRGPQGQNEALVMRGLHIKVLVPPVITGEGAVITGCVFNLRPCTYEIINRW